MVVMKDLTFHEFLCWQAVVVLIELIYNPNFSIFYFWEAVVVLKEMIFNSL